MNHRIYLEKDDSVLLCSESDSGKFKRKFTITEQISKGGASAVCYSAKHDKSGIGVLKEFFPLDNFYFMRNAENQLIHCPSGQKEQARLLERQKAYLEPYLMLMEERKKEELAVFIPPFEIYYGCDKNCNITGTVYIWSPEPKLETFEALCQEIHEHPDIHPEQKLFHVLYAVEALTKCVKALHQADMVHRDIKPENFGFVKRGDDRLTQHISLFDIDTVCSVYHISGNAPFSEGFTEPEAFRHDATNKTDIYSIGATLFYALAGDKENQYLYDKSDFPDLEKLLNHSELIRNIEAVIHPKLKSILLRILQKTLCIRQDRYRNCEALLEDLQEALYYIAPLGVDRINSRAEEWVLKETDKLLDKNSVLALQYHVYTHPLYQYAEGDTINLLILGFGKYGQKFLDIALQTVQMPGKKLNVTVISDSDEDKRLYLSARPKLTEFFNIDGSLAEYAESYGTVQFITHQITEDEEFFPALHQEKQFHAVFIALGKDELNFSVAESVQKVVGSQCSVSAVQDGKHFHQNQTEVIPVCIRKEVKNDPLYKELERMAFNAHLLWEKNLNVDFDQVIENYKKPYNHDSCIAFVLNMKYKLYGLGLDMEKLSLKEIAEQYFNYIHSDQSAENELIWLEHVRWVIDRIVQGYTSIDDLNQCVSGKTKDEKHKWHICCVGSRPERILLDWSHNDWDNAEEAEIALLDDLEGISVRLHQMYLKHARMEKEHNLLHGEITEAIRSQIDKDYRAVTAFQELISCMEDIWTGDSMQWKRYKGLEDSFLNAVRTSGILNDREKKSIESLESSLHEHFYPVWASQQYCDYKSKDEDLVKGIPFILSYSKKLYLTIPYVTGNHQTVFSNLASATVLNPSQILYLAWCTDQQEINEIIETLPYIANYMNSKKFRSDVEWIIGYPEELKLDKKHLEENFKLQGRISKVKLYSFSDDDEYIAFLEEYLKRRSFDKQNFLLEKNKTHLSGMMRSIFQLSPSYEYHSAKMEFKSVHDCGIVNYIDKQPFITVTDMAFFRLSEGVSGNKSEFQRDYQSLWKKYCSYTGYWKFLCRALKDYASKNDLLMIFRRRTSSSFKPISCRYLIPFSCRKAVSRIIEALISEEIIGKDSHITTISANVCEVMIQDIYAYQKEYDLFFSNIQVFMQNEHIRLEPDHLHHVVRIWYDDLTVSNLSCEGFQKENLELLRYFAQKKYLINLNIDKIKNQVSFIYATPQIKNLLTTEGKMLEIFIYHEAKRTGCFSDIRSSFEIEWEDHVARNEFDCILTKGFSSVFIECKAVKELKTAYYSKISELAKKFGINPKIVMIADTQDSPDTAPNNEKCRKYGSQNGVITISDRTEIEDIGNILISIINNEYHEKS